MKDSWIVVLVDGVERVAAFVPSEKAGVAGKAVVLDSYEVVRTYNGESDTSEYWYEESKKVMALLKKVLAVAPLDTASLWLGAAEIELDEAEHALLTRLKRDLDEKR